MALGVAGLYDTRLLPPDMLEEQPDPDPQATRRLRDFLASVSGGGGWDDMTAGLRAIRPWTARLQAGSFNDIDSLTYLGCDGARERGVERYGETVTRICHYEVDSQHGPSYVTFWLAADGKVADLMSVRDLSPDRALR